MPTRRRFIRIGFKINRLGLYTTYPIWYFFPENDGGRPLPGQVPPEPANQDNTMKKWILLGMMSFWIGAGPVPALGEAPIRIGLIFSMSGLGQEASGDVLQGARLAVEEINHDGGVAGRPLDVLRLDDQSTPIGARQAALKAVEAGVSAVVGTSWSSLSLVIAPILQQAGIPMVSHGSTHPDVTRVGDYIFRVCFSDTFQGEVLARFAREDLGARTSAILVNASSDYSMGLAEVFRKSFAGAGGTVLWKGAYRKETLDFTKTLAPLSSPPVPSAIPDVLFVPGHSRDSALIVKQAAAMGIRTTFLGGDAWQALDRYPDTVQAAEGAYFCSQWHPDVASARSRDLRERFQRRYGKEITAYGPVLVYDAVTLIADAARRAGSPDPGRIREALAATRGFEGVSGLLTFDDNGDPVDKPAVIVTFKGGRMVLVRSMGHGRPHPPPPAHPLSPLGEDESENPADATL